MLLAGVALLIVTTLRDLPPLGHAGPDQASQADPDQTPGQASQAGHANGDQH